MGRDMPAPLPPDQFRNLHQTARALNTVLMSGNVVLYDPTDQPWAERLAYALDPMGNPIHITAPIG